MSKKHLLLVFSTAVISGVAIFLNSLAVKLSDPSQYTLLKNLVPVLIISSILLFGSGKIYFKNVAKKDWFLLIAIGLLGGSIPFILFFKGLALTSGTVGAFIHKLLFLFVAVLALVFLREKIKKIFFVPALAIIVGCFLILKADLTSIGLPHIFILLYLLFTNNLPAVSNFSVNLFAWLGVAGILLTAYLLTWYYGLKELPVTLASSILILGLPITVFLNYLFQNKELIAEQILGIFLVLLGVIFIIYTFINIDKKIKILDIRNCIPTFLRKAKWAGKLFKN